MWKSLTVLFCGVLAGVSAHLGYFNAYRPECITSAMECEMEWLRAELNLSEDQFARVTQVHDESGRQIQALAKKVREMQLMLAQLEAERVREGYVDFLEMRSYMEAKRQLDEACQRSTSELIASVGDIMDSEQRRRYFTIVGSRLN